jgi:hypothetical protein
MFGIAGGHAPMIARASDDIGSRHNVPVMPLVFVSHAAADAPLVDPFVNTILKLGCRLSVEEIFYSSGEDTGVPSGTDLMHHVRDRVGEAGLVVAIISPMFQTRPVCVAELGAAWSRTGNLFPLAVPGMERPEMEGVLQGMTVRHINESAALDELHDAVAKLRGEATPALTWSPHKATWLANVDSYVAQLTAPTVVTVDELERVQTDLAGTQAALAESERERRALALRLERVAEAATAEDRREALLPEDERERFEALVGAANGALRGVSSIVIDALFGEMAEGGMAWPDGFDDRYRRDQVTKALQDGDLVERHDESLHPDLEMTSVSRAWDAITAVQRFLEESSEEFDNWFRDAHDGPPDLRKRLIFDSVFG